MKKFFSLLVILLLINSSISEAKEKLIFGAGGIEKNERIFRIGNNLLQEISKKMGVTIQLVPLPAKRATLMLRQGKIHAEISRLSSYQEMVPTSIRVREPIRSQPFYVYTLSKSIKVDGWDSLKQYTVVYIRGHIFLETFLKNNNRHAVHSTKAALHFLKAKRADIFIGDSLNTTTLINSSDFVDEGIIRLDPAITVLNTFTFFSSKYPDLAMKYHKALLEIKEEGIYQRVFLETR